MFILVAGLHHALLSRAPAETIPTLSALKHRARYRPAFPAVTCTAQATLTTGTTPDHHGIIANGLYTHANPELHQHLDLSNHADARTSVSFWEQSNTLLQSSRLWHAPGAPKKKTATLFWQNSMRGAADIVITPKPTHTPDGKTLTACWSDPPDLYATLTAQLGPFPLHNYWSPMAGLPSSQWIAKSAAYVWQNLAPDLQLVYIPHLDFNLQRLGPNHPAILKDLQDIDVLLAPLAAQVRSAGDTLVIAGDYGMYEVDTPILPNRALRDAGLLKTKPDPDGKLLINYDASDAFVMADHQVAFLYCKPDALRAARGALENLPGLARIDTDLGAHHLATPRAGSALLLAKPNAWFAHDWWHDDAEKPRWQFSVDIHNKPGFDPRELFFDPARKCIAQNPALVKGSHGLSDDPARWPVLLTDTQLPELDATKIFAALAT
jgi:predicted AlkP superfamily pyrophosphatase or phosphodiesterase